MQILLALFCLGITIAAWQAWRSNPLYSLKSTLENAFVFLLGLTLVIGFGDLIANHLPSQSLAATVMSIMVFLSVIVLGMIAVSMRITDGPIAKAPPGTAPYKKNRRRLYPWSLVTALVLFLLLGWAARVSPADAETPVSLAAMVICVGSAILGGLYLKARRTDYAIAALTNNFWVHWQYASGQSEAWLGFDGLLCGSQYTPWLTSGNYLTNAHAEPGPPASLILMFTKLSGGAFPAPVTIRVPIPQGRESDLKLLEGKLHTRCPKAHIDFGWHTG